MVNSTFTFGDTLRMDNLGVEAVTPSRCAVSDAITANLAKAFKTSFSPS